MSTVALGCLSEISRALAKSRVTRASTNNIVSEIAALPLDAPEGKDRDLIVLLLRRLRSAESPYKERHVAVWQGKAGESEAREPDAQGSFRNASLTHLGSIEVIRLDAQNQPAGVWFVPLDEVRGAIFSPAIFGLAKLFFDSLRPDEIVLLPLLYGISWNTPNSFDRDGTMTRFISHIETDDGQGTFSIGVGHQDFVVKGQKIIGLGSIGELMVGLSVSDPKFEVKCRARGLDPAEVRRSIK